MILIGGIGNIFLGDDAFGSEVAHRLSAQFAAPDVRIIDFGIRSLDLVSALLDKYDAVALVDAVSRGGKPGTVCVIAPDLNELDNLPVSIEAHTMDPLRVLAFARSMGAELKNIRIVGCEPETFGADNEGMMGLSPSVAAAIDPAIEAIESLITEFRAAKATHKPDTKIGQG
jgi:hydrogenase maturation protease